MPRHTGDRPPRAGASGLLVVDKPEGPTSHDVVAVARRALATREVGHTGTLDPMATGVLVLVLGRATRLAQFLSGHQKSYDARVRLGVATDSWDRTGRALSEALPVDRLPDAAAIAKAATSFLGDLEQAPPPFSAKKVAGERAYDLARRGDLVAIKPARVTLHEIAVLGVELPFVDLHLRCSAGFYVRGLADALGRRLGCGACLERLRRTASGRFTLADALALDTLQRAPGEAATRVLPVEDALPEFPAAILSERGADRAQHGNDVGPGEWSPGGDTEAPAIRLVDGSGRLLAIARPTGRAGVLHPVVVLG